MANDKPQITPNEKLIRMHADEFRLSHLPSLPTMASWFDPKLLSELLLKVIVSDVFGQYADRRLIEALWGAPAEAKDEKAPS